MKAMCDSIFKDVLLSIMKELVKAKTGFLYYEEVCTHLGKLVWTRLLQRI